MVEHNDLVFDWEGLRTRFQAVNDALARHSAVPKPGHGLDFAVRTVKSLLDRYDCGGPDLERQMFQDREQVQVIWLLGDSLCILDSKGIPYTDQIQNLVTGSTDYGQTDAPDAIYFKDFELELSIAALIADRGTLPTVLPAGHGPFDVEVEGLVELQVKHPRSKKRIWACLRQFDEALAGAGKPGIDVLGLESAVLFNPGSYPSRPEFDEAYRKYGRNVDKIARDHLFRFATRDNICGLVSTFTLFEQVTESGNVRTHRLSRKSNSIAILNHMPKGSEEIVWKVLRVFNPDPRKVLVSENLVSRQGGIEVRAVLRHFDFEGKLADELLSARALILPGEKQGNNLAFLPHAINMVGYCALAEFADVRLAGNPGIQLPKLPDGFELTAEDWLPIIMVRDEEGLELAKRFVASYLSNVFGPEYRGSVNVELFVETEPGTSVAKVHFRGFPEVWPERMKAIRFEELRQLQ